MVSNEGREGGNSGIGNGLPYWSSGLIERNGSSNSSKPSDSDRVTRSRVTSADGSFPSLRDYLLARYEVISTNLQKFFDTGGITIHEMLNFDPHSLRSLVPLLTTSDYCGFCAEDKGNRSSHERSRYNAAKEALKPPNSWKSKGERPDVTKIVKKCSTCDTPIIPNLDYGNFNSMFWLYLIRKLDLDCSAFLNGTLEENICDVFRLLPLLRSYQSLDVLGNNTFKHQCYFATHLIYLFSDYGRHVLCREMFAEEFLFMLDSLPVAIQCLDDPEIVGEFLQCLKILQVTNKKIINSI